MHINEEDILTEHLGTYYTGCALNQMLSTVASQATIGSTGSALCLDLSLPAASLGSLAYSIMMLSTQAKTSMNGKLTSTIIMKIKWGGNRRHFRMPANMATRATRGMTVCLPMRVTNMKTIALLQKTELTLEVRCETGLIINISYEKELLHDTVPVLHTRGGLIGSRLLKFLRDKMWTDGLCGYFIFLLVYRDNSSCFLFQVLPLINCYTPALFMSSVIVDILRCSE